MIVVAQGVIVLAVVVGFVNEMLSNILWHRQILCEHLPLFVFDEEEYGNACSGRTFYEYSSSDEPSELFYF